MVTQNNELKFKSSGLVSTAFDIDMKELQAKFDGGLATIFDEVKAIKLESRENITAMSDEEFEEALKQLDESYQQTILNIIRQQFAKELKQREFKKSKVKSQLYDIKLTLSKLSPNSAMYSTYQSAYEAAKQQLASLEIN